MSTSALPTPASTSSSGEPRLSPAAIVALGDGLIAISNELHTTAAAESHSLNGWLQWLEDEGYDGSHFVEALQSLCRQQLDAATYAQLQATASARADQPEGMQQAIDHLNEIDPVLLEEILKIEQTRQEQLQVLNARAGGVNKKNPYICTVEAMGGLGVGVGIYKLVQKWCRRPAEAVVDREVVREGEMVHAEVRAGEREAVNVVQEDPQAQAERLQREAFPELHQLKEGGAITLKKDVRNIFDEDIVKTALDFSTAHRQLFTKSYGKDLMENETTRLYHQSSDIKKLLKEHTVKLLKENPDLLRDSERQIDAYAEQIIEGKFKGNLAMLEKINNSAQFKKDYSEGWAKFQSGITNNELRKPFGEKLTARYKELIKNSVDKDKANFANEITVEGEYKIKVQLQEDIFDDVLLKNADIQEKIDLFCVGKVREKAPEFESMAKESAKQEEAEIAYSARNETVEWEESLARDLKKEAGSFYEDVEVEIVDDSGKAIKDMEKTAEDMEKDIIGSAGDL